MTFKIGDLVHYKDDPRDIGIIVSVRSEAIVTVMFLYKVYWFGYESNNRATSPSQVDWNSDHELHHITKETKQ